MNIGRFCTMILLLVVLYFVQIMNMIFMNGSFDVESPSEKIGVICAAISLSFPLLLTLFIMAFLESEGLI